MHTSISTSISISLPLSRSIFISVSIPISIAISISISLCISISISMRLCMHILCLLCFQGLGFCRIGVISGIGLTNQEASGSCFKETLGLKFRVQGYRV